MDQKEKLREKSWVNSLLPRLEQAIQNAGAAFTSARVADGRKLPYTFEIHEYHKNEVVDPEVSRYETDLLFFDALENERWIPRLVVECKLGSVSTHDALTYSSKAATHKHVHPYLRYGILIGKHGDEAIPWRLFKHGAYFDFMATWVSAEPSAIEWSDFVELVIQEIEASRKMQVLLTTNRSPKRTKYRVIHRPLRLK